MCVCFFLIKEKVQSSYLEVRVSQRGFQGERLCHVRVLTPERRLSSHLGAAEPQPAPARRGAEPTSKCLHLVPPTSMAALGVVRIGTRWKLPGHLTLYFLGSTRLNSLHQSSRLCHVSLLRAEAKGDRQRRAGPSLRPREGREEPPPLRRSHARGPAHQCHLSRRLSPELPSHSREGGGGEEADAKHPYTFRKCFLILSL